MKDLSYSTFFFLIGTFLFYFPSFHLSSELIFTAAFVSSLFTLSFWFYFAPLLKKKKKKKFDTFYYTPLIFVEVIFLLVWCSLLLFFYPVVLVLFCPTSQKRKKRKKKKKKEWCISSLSPLLSLTIATILDLLSQRSRRENC